MTAITAAGASARRGGGITGVATAVETMDRALSTRRRPWPGGRGRRDECGQPVAAGQRGYPWLVADMVYDDAYFARSAGHLLEGNWLGPYDMLTLSKGPTYPLFIAGAYQLHLPLKLAEHAPPPARRRHARPGPSGGSPACGCSPSPPTSLVALNPAYLGSAASRVSREVVYGPLSLILVAGLVVFLTYVPALVAPWTALVGPRGRRSSGRPSGSSRPPTTCAARSAPGSRRRSWSRSLAGAARLGTASAGAWLPKTLLAGGAVLMAGLVLAGSLQWVSARNEEQYGAAVVTDLVEGEIADAYAQWQRVDVGEARRFVVVTERPAAAPSTPSAPRPPRCAATSSGPRTARCGAPAALLADVCDDYTGAQFVWALRLSAATRAGHMDSADETYEFFGRDRRRHRGRVRRRVRLHAAGHRLDAAARPGRRSAPSPASVFDTAWLPGQLRRRRPQPGPDRPGAVALHPQRRHPRAVGDHDRPAARASATTRSPTASRSARR